MFRTYSITIGGEVYKSGPFLDADYVHESLLRRHLFPAVRDDSDEMPPVFSSDTLTMDLSDAVYNLLPGDKRTPIEQRKESFSPMRYTFLKFNGNVRSMQIPHPIPHMRLAHEISEHWNELYELLQSDVSRIRPKVHEDGRLVTMEYGDKTKEAMEEATRLVGKRYVAHADIANCFPSVYTHAIDWALRGRPKAKENRSKANWQARIDMRVSDLQDGETNGVGIGPASSNIVTEIILQSIDKELIDKKYEFTRYIDDYHCYAETKEQAEEFVYALNDALYAYRLTLNHRKTEIVDVESNKLESWLHEVRLIAIDANDTDLTIIRKLRSLQQLARDYPSVSILKYGLKSLEHTISQLDSKVFHRIVPEISRMIWVSPFLTAKSVKYVLPYLDPDSEGASIFAQSLKGVLEESVKRKQADVAMWSIFGLSQLDQIPAKSDLLMYTEWNPVCMSLGLALSPSTLVDGAVVLTQQVNSKVRQLVEEQWLLRYQLWLMDALKDSDLNPKSEGIYFPVLRDYGADFFQSIQEPPEPTS